MKFTLNEARFREELGDSTFVQRGQFFSALSVSLEVDGVLKRLVSYQVIPCKENALFAATIREDNEGVFALLPSTLPIVTSQFTGLVEDAVSGAREIVVRLSLLSAASAMKTVVKAYDRARSTINTRIKDLIKATEYPRYEDLFTITVNAIAPPMGLATFESYVVRGDQGNIWLFANYTKISKSSGVWFSELKYGTCSTCDSLARALSYHKKDERLKALNSICLHMVQNLKESLL